MGIGNVAFQIAMPNTRQLSASKGRQAMYAALRHHLASEGYCEVETPALVPAPGMEPHIDAFSASFVPQMGIGQCRPLYLITSPEYAMKRLLADGSGPIFQICKAFRNGEVSPTHNPEFTLLELYRPMADYRGIMYDLERALAAVETRFPASRLFGRLPYERVKVHEAFLRETGIDLQTCEDASSLRLAAQRAGLPALKEESFEDLFFRIFLDRVEPTLGRDGPTFLIDYPSSMAALARLKPDDGRIAERFELYAGGLELANGFSELIDPNEQRRRLLVEQETRRAAGKPSYPLDEAFLASLSRMPPSGGVAVGLDRVLMLLLGARAIEDVLLFPARDFV
jgi:elongation factor P--(R)-beta-lysine ligase